MGRPRKDAYSDDDVGETSDGEGQLARKIDKISSETKLS